MFEADSFVPAAKYNNNNKGIFKFLLENEPYSKNDRTDNDSCEEREISDEVGDQRTHVGVETEVIDKVEAKTTGHIVELKENKLCNTDRGL